MIGCSGSLILIIDVIHFSGEFSGVCAHLETGQRVSAEIIMPLMHGDAADAG